MLGLRLALVASIVRGINMARLFLASCLLLFALGGNPVGFKLESSDEWQMSTVKVLRGEAERGSSEAQFQLGIAYFQGEAIDQDFDHCAFWISKAAFAGHPHAQGFLGAMHSDGVGVPKSDEEAFVWFSIAAANGDEYAMEGLERLARRLTPIAFLAAQLRAKRLDAKIQKGAMAGKSLNPGSSRQTIRLPSNVANDQI